MREHKQSNFTISLAAILIAVVFGMMLIESDFFEHSESARYTELKNNSHRIDLGPFSIRTPQSFKYVKQEGIDSYVGLITNGKDSIVFDFGWYSNDLTSEDYSLSNEQINGRKAEIGYSNTYGTAIHFPNLADNNSLTVYSGTLPKETALDIYKTIKIRN